MRYTVGSRSVRAALYAQWRQPGGRTLAACGVQPLELRGLLGDQREQEGLLVRQRARRVVQPPARFALHIVDGLQVRPGTRHCRLYTGVLKLLPPPPLRRRVEALNVCAAASALNRQVP